MAEVTSTDPAPVAASPVEHKDSFIKRELSGATFLSLEHALHMGLVVVVAGLIAIGIASALSMWTGGAGTASVMLGAPATAMLGGAFQSLEALGALSLVAALVILVPLLVVLDRRTRAEWVKRPGYSQRLAYKLPVYGALAILCVAKVIVAVTMLAVVLQSLAFIGVANENIGHMYLTQFVPALVAGIVFGAATWYIFKLAKGQDMSRTFTALAAAVGVIVAIALFITAFIVLRSPVTTTPLHPTFESRDGDDSKLEDIFKY